MGKMGFTAWIDVDRKEIKMGRTPSGHVHGSKHTWPEEEAPGTGYIVTARDPIERMTSQYYLFNVRGGGKKTIPPTACAHRFNVEDKLTEMNLTTQDLRARFMGWSQVRSHPCGMHTGYGFWMNSLMVDFQKRLDGLLVIPYDRLAGDPLPILTDIVQWLGFSAHDLNRLRPR